MRRKNEKTVSKTAIAQLLFRQHGRCPVCKGTLMEKDDRIQVHHRDRDPSNNALENLVCVHSWCHARVHASRAVRARLPKRWRLPQPVHQARAKDIYAVANLLFGLTEGETVLEEDGI